MKIVIGFFLIVFNLTTHAQSSDECKYLSVLTYMRTNSKFNKQLKEHLSLKKIEKKQIYFEFNINPVIEFLDILEFKDKLNYDSLSIDKTTFMNDRLFYEKNHFDTFESVFLGQIIEKNSSKYYLTFSKPFGNLLIVEMLNFENRINRVRRFGSGVKILIHFNNNGLIGGVYFNTVMYN
jgi:hypothetical protein